MINPLLFYIVLSIGLFLTKRYYSWRKTHKESKFIILNYLILLLLFLPLSSAITIPTITKSINYGNGYYDNDISAFNITSARNVYILVGNYTVGGGINDVLIIEPIGYASGLSGLTRLVNATSKTVNDALIHNSYLYYGTTDGIYKRITRNTAGSVLDTDIYNPTTNPLGQVVQIATTTTGRIRGYGNYIYFYDITNGRIKRVDTNNLIVQDVQSISGTLLSFDVVSGNVYEAIENYSAATWQAYIDVYKNGVKQTYIPYLFAQHHDACGYYADMDFQMITDSIYYVGWQSRGYDSPGTGCNNPAWNVNGGYYYNGSGYDTWANPSYTNLNTNYFSFNVGVHEALALAKNGGNVDVINVERADISTENMPYELTYSASNIVSNYDSYYNNSNLDISYVMRISDLSSSERTQIFETYYWKIELVDSSGVKIGEYSTISFTCSGILSYTCSSSGRILFQPISSYWDNGTWTVRLYEINATSQSKGLLDDDNFIVLNQFGNVSIAPPIDMDKSATERTNDLLKSNMFWAFVIVITAFGMGLGFGLSGGIVGGAIGVIFTFLMGLLPLWALMLFAFVIVIAFVLIMVRVIS